MSYCVRILDYKSGEQATKDRNDNESKEETNREENEKTHFGANIGHKQLKIGFGKPLRCQAVQ